MSRPEHSQVGPEGRTDARQRRPTQADVARLAGVSQALVSYVLNGTDVSVAPSTKRKILQAIESLGYIPHGAARSLRTRQTMSIALVVPDITNPFWPEVQRGVQEVADRAMASALGEASVSHELINIANGDHGFDQDLDRPDVASAFERVRAFLRRHVADGAEQPKVRA